MGEKQRKKSGPKEDATTHLVTPDWQATVKLRMRLLDINQTKLAQLVGVTRAAISHVLVNAKQSSLVPDIEAVLGIGSKISPTGQNSEGVVPPLRDWPAVRYELYPGSSRQLAELHSIWSELSAFGQGRLLERARTLLDAQRTEEYADSALARRDLRKLIEATERLLARTDIPEVASLTPEKRKELEQHLRESKIGMLEHEAVDVIPPDVRRMAEERAWASYRELAEILNGIGITTQTLRDGQGFGRIGIEPQKTPKRK